MCCGWRSASVATIKNLMPALLQIFAAMSKSLLLLEPGFARSPDDENDQPPRANLPLVCDHHILNEIWKQGLKPNLDQAAKPLLSLVVRRIEDQHRTLSAWKPANNKWDHVSNNRWAIEPHKYNMRPTATDVLIDAARDSLEWLASNQADLSSPLVRSHYQFRYTTTCAVWRVHTLSVRF